MQSYTHIHEIGFHSVVSLQFSSMSFHPPNEFIDYCSILNVHQYFVKWKIHFKVMLLFSGFIRPFSSRTTERYIIKHNQKI